MLARDVLNTRRASQNALRRLALSLARMPLALIACLIAGAWTGPAAVAASPSVDCRTRGTTVAANQLARIYSLDRGDIELFACRYTAKKLGQHAFVGFTGLPNNGISPLRLAGYFVAYRVNGSGCSRSACVGPYVELLDTRHPTQPNSKRRRLPGFAFALRSDGVFAALYPSLPTTPQFPAFPGAPAVVRVWDREGPRQLAQGDLLRDSVALSGTSVYWTESGSARSALVAGPVR